MSQVVIASRLSDGRVVFLSADAAADGRAADAGGGSRWALHLEEATLAETDERAAELLALGEIAASERQEVVEPYLIEVKEEGGQLRPTKYREAIRCLGPTIREDLGKQAERSEA